ncbi:uncharacterized protein HMPREF1120_02260 [Exophiala dermatitidis NIH/UT8656]|uniref:Uncharacterized protein n=1 Tax=Exophiala dermatitidis (strain ATCC 34100 / CBS 525.76 / NIH/UT8656) TaxID=858893 RepID=H6BS28_EXODN|nr:uncharacterized protein HMPREF1120_02260 [Exophiala dermatitidis NIH/UT8656]EHY54083.1 hypothetical protein HMPREF1120_02260 [Exophiala dermatitidis NIH/UT8656]
MSAACYCPYPCRACYPRVPEIDVPIHPETIGTFLSGSSLSSWRRPHRTFPTTSTLVPTTTRGLNARQTRGIEQEKGKGNHDTGNRTKGRTGVITEQGQTAGQVRKGRG